jgi:hypothetical protein
MRLIPSDVWIGNFPAPTSWVAAKNDMHMEVPEGITGV